MGRRRGYDPHDEADALLHEWGAQYELIEGGLFPGTSEGDAEQYGTRIDTCGHSDPTADMVAKRNHLLTVDAAVRAVQPTHLRRRLYEQYVWNLYQETAASGAGIATRAWRLERDTARLCFWNLYHERRRLARGTTGSGSDGQRAQRVVDRG